ncbi:MAG: membrane protein insertion efficiency factor YidD, partial [Candidatus Eisenbacteria bacterium]|nr:membrane protein insertion efficiency factor YidD [Candidatus Eisenbacteria bacterium]
MPRRTPNPAGGARPKPSVAVPRAQEEKPIATRPTKRSPWVRLLRSLIKLYQKTVSPWLPPACRYVPSCSDYCLTALDEHGAPK